MNEMQTVAALTALAHVQRLRAFRALVVAGPAGLIPSLLAAELGVAPSALSFHLKELAHAELVSAEQHGRNWVYRARFDTMDGLLGYMTEHCCTGTACELVPAAACTDEAGSPRTLSTMDPWPRKP